MSCSLCVEQLAAAVDRARGQVLSRAHRRNVVLVFQALLSLAAKTYTT